MKKKKRNLPLCRRQFLQAEHKFSLKLIERNCFMKYKSKVIVIRSPNSLLKAMDLMQD